MTERYRNLLIIDDDKLFCDAVAAYFHSGRVRVSSAQNGDKGLSWLKKNKADVVLLDQKLPDCQGTELCSRILAFNDQTKIIFVTAFPSFEHAIEALRNGAHDYISKPMELEELRLTVEMAFRTVHLEQVEQIENLRHQRDCQKNILLGLDGGLAGIRDLLERAAGSQAPVLITGETGTGKTVVARAIHYLGNRADRPFIDTNCAALPESLVESELFGHERGAFTGAESRKKGLFEMADGGTLFLDEIGEMPLHLQPKLLGVLDSRTFRRLGGQVECSADVRIIAATNLNLEDAIQKKRFREDLYYRMSVMRIHLPALRERTGDIRVLVNHFSSVISPDRRYSISDEEINALKQYEWPGNVRELRNIVERAILLADGPEIFPARLLREGKNHSRLDADCIKRRGELLSMTLGEMEKRHIQQVLAYHDSNRSQAAATLGIARSTLLRKIEQYSLT